MTPDSTDQALPILDAARRDIGGKIAWLAVQAIARRARDAEPEIAWIELWPDHEGEAFYLKPCAYHAADGTDLALASLPANAIRAPHAPRRRDWDEGNLRNLTRKLIPLCRYLDETNSGAWGDVTTEPGADEVTPIADDGVTRLHVSLALSLNGPAPADAPLYLPELPGIDPELPGIDARHTAQPHPCTRPWDYGGLNGGGHEVFACAGGHRLIAPHPSGIHLCTDLCATTVVTAPYPA